VPTPLHRPIQLFARRLTRHISRLRILLVSQPCLDRLPSRAPQHPLRHHHRAMHPSRLCHGQQASPAIAPNRLATAKTEPPMVSATVRSASIQEPTTMAATMRVGLRAAVFQILVRGRALRRQEHFFLARRQRERLSRGRKFMLRFTRAMSGPFYFLFFYSGFMDCSCTMVVQMSSVGNHIRVGCKARFCQGGIHAIRDGEA